MKQMTNMYGDVFNVGDEVIMHPSTFPVRKVVKSIFRESLYFERHSNPVHVVHFIDSVHGNSCCTLERFEEEFKND